MCDLEKLLEGMAYTETNLGWAVRDTLVPCHCGCGAPMIVAVVTEYDFMRPAAAAWRTYRAAKVEAQAAQLVAETEEHLR